MEAAIGTFMAASKVFGLSVAVVRDGEVAWSVGFGMANLENGVAETERRQLLAHLGGIRSYKLPEYPYTQSQSDPEVGNARHFENGIEGSMRFFANDPLVAQPGTHFRYSTQGYTLAACAIRTIAWP